MNIYVSVYQIIKMSGPIGMSVHAYRDNKCVFTRIIYSESTQLRRESFSERSERVSSTNLNERPEVTSIDGNVSCNIRSLALTVRTPHVYTTPRLRHCIHGRVTAFAAASFGCDIIGVIRKKRKTLIRLNQRI